jgi:hypothetical protein
MKKGLELNIYVNNQYVGICHTLIEGETNLMYLISEDLGFGLLMQIDIYFN